MLVKQLYTGCLSEAAYYIESNGEAAIVDPLRDIEAYLQLAAERKTRIRYIFETHFHADFVSGHHELAAKTGAKIYFGSRATPSFSFVPVHEGDDTLQVIRQGGRAERQGRVVGRQHRRVLQPLEQRLRLRWRIGDEASGRRAGVGQARQLPRAGQKTLGGGRERCARGIERQAGRPVGPAGQGDVRDGLVGGGVDHRDVRAALVRHIDAAGPGVEDSRRGIHGARG